MTSNAHIFESQKSMYQNCLVVQIKGNESTDHNVAETRADNRLGVVQKLL